jgi:hypothetical protein
LPNFKIFQDNPDQAKIKIYGSNNAAFNTDTSGNLTITSTGLAITPPANGLTITSTGLAITPPANGLTITSTGLAITPPSNGLLITSSGLAIATGTTDVSYARGSITDTAGTADTSYNVLGIKNFTFAVVNASTEANAQAVVKLQISPDSTTWQDDAGPVTINQNALGTLVSAVFLKYARVFYSAANAASAVTLNIFFQGQT